MIRRKERNTRTIYINRNNFFGLLKHSIGEYSFSTAYESLTDVFINFTLWDEIDEKVIHKFG